MNNLSHLPEVRQLWAARGTALENLSGAAKIQKDLAEEIYAALKNNTPIDSLLEKFDPSKIPIELFPFLCLETAIKLGELEAVKKLFSCYEKMTDYKEKMLTSFYMEVPYRPIFWLAAVCTSENVTKACKRETPKTATYIKIMEFMETKLDIPSDYIHKNTLGAITREEYIKLFGKMPKKDEIKAYIEQRLKNPSN